MDIGYGEIVWYGIEMSGLLFRWDGRSYVSHGIRLCLAWVGKILFLSRSFGIFCVTGAHILPCLGSGSRAFVYNLS